MTPFFVLVCHISHLNRYQKAVSTKVEVINYFSYLLFLNGRMNSSFVHGLFVQLSCLPPCLSVSPVIGGYSIWKKALTGDMNVKCYCLYLSLSNS